MAPKDTKKEVKDEPVSFVFDKMVYFLRHPLDLIAVYEDSSFIVHDEDLKIVGTGSNEDEAINSYMEEFADTYKKLTTTDDVELSEYNIQIKKKLKKLVIATAQY